MKTLVRILAQYFENYNHYDGGTPNWKQKGGQEFTMYVDSDYFLYEEETCVEVIKAMLQEQSNGSTYHKFEYVSHELVFHAPIEIEGFNERIHSVLTERNTNK